MKTVKALWGQRMKWQVGTIEDLIAIGVNRLTLVDWLQQLAGISAAFARYLWLAVILVLCLAGDLNFQWIWWVFVPLFFVAVQVKHALRIPHRDRTDLVYALLIYPAETFAWLRAGWFTAAWVQAPIALLMGTRKDRWQAQYSAESFKRSILGRIRLLVIRLTALTIAGVLVLLSVGNLYPASGLPTVASVARVGPAETMDTSAPVRCTGYVALTYDDGPTAFAAATSDLLRRYRLHATFFVTGEQIQKSPDVVYALAADGHEIGIHAGHIRRLTELPLAQAKAEIDQTSKLIEDTTGHRPKLFRPAYGDSNDAIAKFVAKEKIPEALWTLDTNDWLGKTASEIDDVVDGATDGDIILMHDDRDTAIKAVPLIAATLRRHNLCTGRIVADTERHDIALLGKSHSVKVVPWQNASSEKEAAR
jgi:peptidoglycan/xylan/chitin deacetylase (PgdA/CDA1 family)